jgi:hypothetical protein
MTRNEASQLIAILFASYPSAHVERTHVDAYVSGIIDLPASDAGESVTRLRRTSKFLPTVAEIRAACAAQTHGVARTGEEAYAELTRAVRIHGRDYGQGTPKFGDPLIAQCLGVWGSWNDLCGSPGDDPGGRARFIELYGELVTRARLDLSAGKPLPAPASTQPAFWLDPPKPAPAPKAALQLVTAFVARRRQANAGKAQIVPQRWSADELEAALVGAAK